MISVLVVDDHPMVRDGLEVMLSPRRIFKVVHCCANGEEAVAYVRDKGCPDIILSDVRMPVMNGFEMTEKLSIPARESFSSPGCRSGRNPNAPGRLAPLATCRRARTSSVCRRLYRRSWSRFCGDRPYGGLGGLCPEGFVGTDPTEG